MPHRSTFCCDLLLLATVSFCWLLLLLLLPLAAHVSAFFGTLTMWAFYKVPPLRFLHRLTAEET